MFHLPQVAVYGSVHYVVTKQGDEHPETNLCILDEDHRVEEIARMHASPSRIKCLFVRIRVPFGFA